MKVISIDTDNDGVRIDRVLRKALPQSPLSSVYGFIRKGKVKVNGKRIKHNYHVKTGDTIELYVLEEQAAPDTTVETDKIYSLYNSDFFRKSFRIVYEDEHVLVCDKPKGLVVHSGTGHLRHDTLIDCAQSYIMHRSKKGAFTEPVLVHRIDRDTSGVILIAKDKQTLRFLHTDMRGRRFEKKYIALCHGRPPVKQGVIAAPLLRTHVQSAGMKMAVGDDGLDSRSSFRVTGAQQGISRMEVLLHTGRTHQIRVHLLHIGCPIIGDERYGDRDKDRVLFEEKKIPRRLYLHAEEVSFYHPAMNREITISAPVPDCFNMVCSAKQ